MSLCLILRSLIQLFGPKRVNQLLNCDIIEFPEEGYLLHFKLEFPEGENQLLYSCAYWQTRQRLRAPSSNFTCRRKLYHWEGFETAHTYQEDIWALYLYLYGPYTNEKLTPAPLTAYSADRPYGRSASFGWVRGNKENAFRVSTLGGFH